MPNAEIRRVSYAFNSALADAGEDAYFLDILVARDGAMVVDHHASYRSKGELYEAMEQVLPALEGLETVGEPDEDWQG